MKTRTCEHCRGPMPLTARKHARTCSGRCRTAACRTRRTLPTELTSRARWVRRTSRKLPITVDGAPASSTDPATWARYRDAARSTAGAGLGYVLVEGDGLVCLDLDHCLYGDTVAPWAQRILDAAGPTWVERSVSGDGLHVWGTGSLSRGRRIAVGTGSVELYGTGRYIAITGDTWGGTPRRLADLSGVIDELL